MAVECYCDVNAYALKGTCECEEDCICKCEGCDCNTIDLWYSDTLETSACSCGGNCSCGQTSNDTS